MLFAPNFCKNVLFIESYCKTSNWSAGLWSGIITWGNFCCDSPKLTSFVQETRVEWWKISSVMMIVIFAAAAAVAVFVVNETFLEELVGIVQSAVVVPLMMLVKLN